MTNPLHPLIERHCEWLSETVGEIRLLVANLNTDRQVARRAYELTHEITGSSGTMGFAQVSAAAAVLEEKLKPMSAQPAPYPPFDLLHVQSLYNDLATASHGVEPRHSSLFNVDLAAMAR
ncbi:Hpt domain-containing protein [Tepidamorphus sp. 3E244]|uniref:Hpt domain-containing protein n=1 Tax=Tepidamorphus sp. 3E244 TaxID=3385498 RepID=UPI0038FD293C